MSRVLRETIPMRTGMSLPGLSAEKAAGPSIDEIRRKRIAIHPLLLIGFSLHGTVVTSLLQHSGDPCYAVEASRFPFLSSRKFMYRHENPRLDDLQSDVSSLGERRLPA